MFFFIISSIFSIKKQFVSINKRYTNKTSDLSVLRIEDGGTVNFDRSFKIFDI